MTRSKLASNSPSISDLGPPLCHWQCGAKVGGSPYRTPVVEVIGARWLVCGPDCPKRPPGVQVFSIGLDHAND